jgi:predicted DNA binding protein
VVSIIATQVLPGHRILTLLDLYGPDPRDYAEASRQSPGVFAVSELGFRRARTRLQVISRMPAYLTLAERHEALLRYPRVVKNGWYVVEVAAQVCQLRELVAELRRLSRSVQIVRFGRDPMRTFPPTLTAHQHALLHHALAAGYFDVPRRVTLTELAGMLHRSKSSLSQTLARVERELAESSVIPSA